MSSIINMHELWLKEMDKHSAYVNGKIERGIEENRKGLFNIKIVDVNGESVKCDNVHIKQVSHEFKHGAPLFVIDQLDSDQKNKRYKELFTKIFNYAIAPMYRKDLEPQRGEYRFEKNSPFIWRRPPLDSVVEFCQQNGLSLKGHCLVYNSFNPDWMQDLTYREMNISVEEYIKAIADRYGNAFEELDVINEMYTIYKNCYAGCGQRNLSITDEPDHVYKMFGLANKYFPYTKLFWNEGSFETFGTDRYKGERSQYYMMLKTHLDQGASIHGIGMQYHMFATQGTEYFDKKASTELCNPLRIFDVLDCYGKFNLPISISEISVPSYTNNDTDERLQAEIVKRLYSIFFSQKQVDSLVWWNLADNMAFMGEDEFMAGLVRQDLSVKPAYQTIVDLFDKEWHTELDVKQQDVIEFNGFYGNYEISFIADGKEYKKQVRLFRENTGYDNRLLAPRPIKIIK